MVAAGEQKIAEILIIAESAEPLTPCGACRQRISEFAMQDTKVHSAGPTGVRETMTFGELFPRPFGPSTLG
jgi:cytidine deaminase